MPTASLQTNSTSTPNAPSLLLLGLGSTGSQLVDQIAPVLSLPGQVVAVDTDERWLVTLSHSRRIILGKDVLRGFPAPSLPLAASIAQENLALFRELCRGKDFVVFVVGLGGITGSAILPIAAQAAIEEGCLVIAFVTTPWSFEQKESIAQRAIQQSQGLSHLLIEIPLDSILSILPTDEPLDRFLQLLRDWISGAIVGLIHTFNTKIGFPINWNRFRTALLEHRLGARLAFAEADGPYAVDSVLEKIQKHPLFHPSGQTLEQCKFLLASIVGGNRLTLAVLRETVDELRKLAPSAEVFCGAMVDSSMKDRLAMTLVAGIPSAFSSPSLPPKQESEPLLASSTLPDASSVLASSSPWNPKTEKGAHRSSSSFPSQKKISATQPELPRYDVNWLRKGGDSFFRDQDLDIPTYQRKKIPLD